MKNIILRITLGLWNRTSFSVEKRDEVKKKKTMAVCVKVGDNRCVIEGIIFSSSSWYYGAVS